MKMNVTFENNLIVILKISTYNKLQIAYNSIFDCITSDFLVVILDLLMTPDSFSCYTVKYKTVRRLKTISI